MLMLMLLLFLANTGCDDTLLIKELNEIKELSKKRYNYVIILENDNESICFGREYGTGRDVGGPTKIVKYGKMDFKIAKNFIVECVNEIGLIKRVQVHSTYSLKTINIR